MTQDTFDLAGRACRLYVCGLPRFLLVQPADEHDAEGLDREAALLSAGADAGFALAAFRTARWNDELSPWPAPPVFGREGFGGGAEETLRFVADSLLPGVRSRLSLPEDIPVIPGGYSLAGLFALWCAHRADGFAAAAAASPSVWFPGWPEFSRAHAPRVRRIYLSLGDREEKTKNRTMAAVGERIRGYRALLDGLGVRCALEWNEGNHFREPDVRCAKAFLWCMRAAAEAG